MQPRREWRGEGWEDVGEERREGGREGKEREKRGVAHPACSRPRPATPSGCRRPPPRVSTLSSPMPHQPTPEVNRTEGVYSAICIARSRALDGLAGEIGPSSSLDLIGSVSGWKRVSGTDRGSHGLHTQHAPTQPAPARIKPATLHLQSQRMTHLQVSEREKRGREREEGVWGVGCRV